MSCDSVSLPLPKSSPIRALEAPKGSLGFKSISGGFRLFVGGGECFPPSS